MNTLDLINLGSIKLKKSNIKSFRLDSELLLSKVLSRKREEILINLDKKIQLNKIEKFYSLIERRSKREPIAYILKEKEFWSNSFEVDKFTLIPRPETELMVEQLVKIFKNKEINILDIGTGSGCIIISLVSELKRSKGTAIDLSNKALKIAFKNAQKNNLLSKIKFICRSLCDVFNKKYDLIVSNPPYVEKNNLNNLTEDVRKFEPIIALDGGNDGLDVIKKVIYKSKNILKVNGILALEIGNKQHKQVSKILVKNKFKILYLIKDFEQNIRCIISAFKS